MYLHINISLLKVALTLEIQRLITAFRVRKTGAFEEYGAGFY